MPRSSKTDEDETSSTSKSTASDSRIGDSLKRYKFLLAQTDIFKHFIEHSGLVPEENVEAPSSRKRKTEKEEDQEMLNQEDESVIVTFTSSPGYIHGVMREYQVQGLNWLISLFDNGINGILADEMGLGKSLQSISLLGYLKHYRSINGPHLVIVPKSTLQNWKNEFTKWIPDFEVFVFHGDKETRSQLIKDRLVPMNFEICITSYEICLLEKSSFKKIFWQYIVIDEAHRIKNENSQLSQIVRVLKCRNRLLLTGTPLQNNLHELWALLNFLLPDVFSSAEAFDSWFESRGDDVVTQLRKVIEPFLLRRLKADVEHSLLPKKEVNLYVGMTSMQKQWYKKILEKDIDAVNGGLKQNKTRLLNIVMQVRENYANCYRQLRKCSNHPYLFDGAEPVPFTTDEHLVTNAGKMRLLDKLLTKFKENGSRVLIFSQMSRMLDILEDYCQFRQYEYCRIDGQTAHEDRVTAIDDFNKKDSEKFVFLLTTRAGGLGINLATADIVILYDSDWNPQVDLQAQDRAHRIGQTKQVYVFRLITENSIEEKMIERAVQKLRLDQLVIQQGKTQPQQHMNQGELLGMIRHGAEMVLGSEEVFEEADIEETLRKGEEKTADLLSKYASKGIQDLFSDTTKASAYEWEGQNYNDKSKNKQGLFFLEPSKRERKVNYAIDEYYRDTLGISSRGPSTKAPKVAKQVATHDFQFFPKRLWELQFKENLYLRKTLNYKVPPRNPGKGETAEQVETLRQLEQEKIDQAVPLTEEEEAEKEKLNTQGFESWTRKDFQSFIKACERFGRTELELIAEEVEGKSLAQVVEYAKVFWKRASELSDYEKIIANIEKGEAKLRRQLEMAQLLQRKVASYARPLQELKFNNNSSRGKIFTEDEDRFLLVKMNQYGCFNSTADEYSVFETIRQDIRRFPLFQFDWFFKSRSVQELHRRGQTLISIIQKEFEERGVGKKRKEVLGEVKAKKGKEDVITISL